MNTRKTSLRRLAAGVGILSLALVGLAGTAATAAPGGNAEPGSIDTTLTGSLTIHKHVDDPDSTDNNPAGAALEGVEFQLEPITNVDLATATGWTTIEAAYAGQPAAAPDMTGLTLGPAIPVTPTDATGVAVADGLDVGAYYVTEVGSGAYYVTEVGSGDNLITAPAIPFIITIPEPNADGTWNYHPVAFPKNDIGVVTPTKSVGAPSVENAVGATVDWTITATVPGTSVGYDEFAIEDALSAGLEFQNWQSVSVGATPLTAGTDYSVDATTKTVNFDVPGLSTLNTALAGGDVVVTAVIRTTVLSVGAHPNTANIVVNGQSFPTNTPQTNWGALQVTKTDTADTTKRLNGAEFEVYAADSAGNATGPVLATGVTGADGVDGVIVFNLYIGIDDVITKSVVLKETRAPQGYVLPANPFSGPYTLQAGSTVEASTVMTTISNHAPTAPKLPLTGSTGTMLFSVVGLGLLAVGGGLLIARGKRSKI